MADNAASRPEAILGISAFFHDAAAALLVDGRPVAAAQEERFSRIKGDPSFPVRAIEYCLAEAGLDLDQVQHVVYHEKPWLHFERLLQTHLGTAPRGLRAYLAGLPGWLSHKFYLRHTIRRALGWAGPVHFTEHHEAHLGAAFFPSPYDRAAVLTIDGVGEWSTTAWGVGQGNAIDIREEIHFPHSLGLLYSAFTAHLGFRVNRGEYKVMGLAPYGEPRFVDRIRDELVEIQQDGSFRLNLDYFSFPHALRMTNRRFGRLFGLDPRAPEAELRQPHLDLARSLQVVTEEVVLGLVRHVHRQSGLPCLTLGGGVALNCVSNGRILREGPFEQLWIQPAAGDAGSALGAALTLWHHKLGRPREADGLQDRQRGSQLGPRYDRADIQRYLDRAGATYEVLDPTEATERVARSIADQQVVGLFQGRLEFGPRALGNRSILGDARAPDMQSRLNLKIKGRESFRPFAPAVLEARAPEYFALESPSPYMLLVAPVRSTQRLDLAGEATGLERLAQQRSRLPAVTHVDYSARIQTVAPETNPGFHAVLGAVERLTGVGCVVNTSFNVRGEPIVCTPHEAYQCFLKTGMDAVLLEGLWISKQEHVCPAPQDPRLSPELFTVQPHLPGMTPPTRPRQAGLLLAAVLAGLGCFGIWRAEASWSWPRLLLLGVAGLLMVLAVVAPRALVPPLGAWSALGKLLGRVTTPVLLTVLWLTILLPVGLLGRLFRWDPLDQRRRTAPDSAWRSRPADPRGPERYEQQF